MTMLFKHVPRPTISLSAENGKYVVRGWGYPSVRYHKDLRRAARDVIGFFWLYGGTDTEAFRMDYEQFCADLIVAERDGYCLGGTPGQPF